MSDRKSLRFFGLVLVAMLLFSLPSFAQEETKGINSGNYNIQQSIEAGYRQDWIDGNQATYGTFVNLLPGLRLMDYTMNMRSVNHQGIFFDNLSFSNFGYGGDPDNVSRLRIQKNKWYDFSLLFRRHKNFWDYNLLGNPLNPVPLAPNNNPVTNPSFGITTTPHGLYRTRRMQDYNLVLGPQTRVRVRLGYSHLIDEGPSLTTFHGTTDFLLAQNFRVTTNVYRFGFDVRALPKTTISYDQTLEYNKQDTSDSLAGLPFLLSFNGSTTPVDMGLNWYYPPTGTTAPCLAPVLSTGFANPTCKGFLSYTRTMPGRNRMPTERISFQSTFFKNIEMSGAFSYSNANNLLLGLNDDANEWTNAAASSGQVRDAIVRGTGEAKQILTRGNLSAIYSLTKKVRILDSFRGNSWRNPGNFTQQATTLFASGPTVAGQTGILLPIANFSPVVNGAPSFASICPGPSFNAATCPRHGTSAAADFGVLPVATYLGQKMLTNTFQIEVDLTTRISGRIGYFYENRKISNAGTSTATSASTQLVYFPGGGGTAANLFLAARGLCAFPTGSSTLPAGCVLNSDGSVTYTAIPQALPPLDTATINQHVALFGLTLRPMDTLNINADFEIGSSDYSYTRIWPRQVQLYKVHASYKPRTWLNVDGAIDIQENRDNVATVNDLEHSRTYSFDTVLAPNSKLSFTLGYNYTDIHMENFICFRDTFGTLSGTGLPTFAACPTSITSLPTNPSAVTLGATSFYSNKQHYAYGDVMWHPIRRITATLGYAGTFAGGSTLFLNPLQPGGTLAFTYQKPFTTIQIDIYKGLSYKITWNYYGYNSKTPINTSVPVTIGTYALQPIAGPDFNGSTAMFALRYAF